VSFQSEVGMLETHVENELLDGSRLGFDQAQVAELGKIEINVI